VLEVEGPGQGDLAEVEGSQQSESAEEQQTEELETPDLDVPTDKAPENFERVDSLDDDYREYMDQENYYRRTGHHEEADAKLEAIKNTAAPPKSLQEHLLEQWYLVDAEDSVKKAGEVIIDYIDDRGYLSVRLEQLHNKDRKDFSYEDLKAALKLIQQLEPVGVGAAGLVECLLIQIEQSDEDLSFEKQLVREYMNELLENHLPGIAKKMGCTIERLNEAIQRLSKFDTSPGLQIGQPRNHIINVDVIVEPADNEIGYSVKLANSPIPSLRISGYYSRMANNKKTSEETKRFLQNNIRSAQWIIDAIAQRKNTLLKVAASIVKHQVKFFDKGELYLKPLPMSVVAGDVRVHVATVSRAVAGKYLQFHGGIVPLRKFFSGGTENENGQAVSWEAIRAKLKQIIDEEDKSKPLSDDKIRKKLEEFGIKGLARRTVAKYRKLLKIPPARMRKKY